MSDKDSDRSFSGMAPIVPERDERIGAGDIAGKRENKKVPPKTDRRPTSSKENAAQSGGGFWRLLVVVLLAAIVACGFLVWQQRQQLAMLQTSFDQLQSRISSTDESLSQSGAALSVKLGDHEKALATHWSEIKKLWGVSNDRNKKAIAANTKAVEDYEKSLKGLKNSAVARQKDVAALKAQMADVKKSVATVTSTSLSARLELEEAREQLQTAADRLNGLDKELKQMQNSLSARVAENEEAIEAIDAHRRRVNQDIQQLRQKLGQPVGSGVPNLTFPQTK